MPHTRDDAHTGEQKVVRRGQVTPPPPPSHPTAPTPNPLPQPPTPNPQPPPADSPPPLSQTCARKSKLVVTPANPLQHKTANHKPQTRKPQNREPQDTNHTTASHKPCNVNREQGKGARNRSFPRKKRQFYSTSPTPQTPNPELQTPNPQLSNPQPSNSQPSNPNPCSHPTLSSEASTLYVPPPPPPHLSMFVT